MRKTRKSAIAWLVILPVVASIVWCGYHFIISPQCDWDDYLIDPKIKEELSVALRDFERQHNLAFDDHYLMNASCTDAGVDVPLEYNTPLSFSKYALIYNLSLSATYSLESREVNLYISDKYPTTEDVLTYIASLKNVIADFETTPQLDEFVNQFKQAGVEIDASFRDEFIWVDADRRAEFSNSCCGMSRRSTLSGQIVYSTTMHSISSYSLPNLITWSEFPEVPVIHEIINQRLLVNGLSNCGISTKKKAYANTVVYFNQGPSTGADVELVCGDTEDEKYVRLILQPDDSYEAEVLTLQPDGSYESEV